MGPRPLPIAVRIRRRINFVGDCWVWQGNKANGGYGLMQVGSRTDGTRQMRLVHRVSYEEFVGPIPDGMQLDHLCRVRACCNPAHLEPVTPHENTQRSPIHVGKRTHCPKGHAYDGDNLIRRNGRRECRACRVLRSQERYARA